MQQVLILIHLIVCFAIVGLVLLQQGKGANMGAAFGSGASNTLFGSRGPASFLMKLTGGLVALFFITSLTIGYLNARAAKAQNQFAAPAIQSTTPTTTTKTTKQTKTQQSGALKTQTVVTEKKGIQTKPNLTKQ